MWVFSFYSKEFFVFLFLKLEDISHVGRCLKCVFRVFGFFFGVLLHVFLLDVMDDLIDYKVFEEHGLLH